MRTSDLAAEPVMSNTDYECEITAWRATRLQKLTTKDGWTQLVGLLWLEPGDNSFGRAASNRLALENPRIPEHLGTFSVAGREVRFVAAPGAQVMHAGRPVRAIGPLQDDAAGAPTVLSCGSVSFYLIERSGRLGIRVKDSQAEAHVHFRGLEYFRIDPKWRLAARVEAYSPVKKVSIINVLGMEEEMQSPGALLFEVDGKPYRLDAVLEVGERDWFVMFADQTNGKQTYGAGRFLYVAPPVNGETVIDFNKSYSPPCSFSAFATCPLPPPQNRLAVAVTVGELKYTGSDH
ncbi:MAG: DUF1684 domain-containing protein [Gammaproteobacteria bacterium]|nr:DUF1684 domain-containing protein [Gammaproteobacteria bacterium]